MNTQTHSNMTHAVVIGASMAGLVTARVLAEHFAVVTLIDRDELPAEPMLRKGAPQARHVHVLLGRGHQVIEALFPGITETLVEAGASQIEYLKDARTQIATGRLLPRVSTGKYALTCSRTLLEHTVRQRVLKLSNVNVLSGYSVAGLLTDEARTRITGVRVQALGAQRETLRDTERLDADFVVDCAGRPSRITEWLAALGYATPDEEIVDAQVGYATRWYERPTTDGRDWEWFSVLGSVEQNGRGGMIYPVEGGRWVVTVVGAAADYPPTDEDGFVAFVRSLANTDFADAVLNATPLTPVYGYQKLFSRWRHFERLAAFPDGLAVLGDAACAFNPIYGQGMTAAALSALALGRTLHRHGNTHGVGLRFQRLLARIVAAPWAMSTGEDFRYPTTTGKSTPVTRLMHRLLDRIFAVMPDDPEVARVFVDVMQMLKPASALMTPRLLWHIFRPRTRRAAPAAHTGKRATATMAAV